MSKRIAWLAAASLSVASVALGYWQYREANKPVFFRGEHEEELGRPLSASSLSPCRNIGLFNSATCQ